MIDKKKTFKPHDFVDQLNEILYISVKNNIKWSFYKNCDFINFHVYSNFLKNQENWVFHYFIPLNKNENMLLVGFLNEIPSLNFEKNININDCVSKLHISENIYVFNEYFCKSVKELQTLMCIDDDLFKKFLIEVYLPNINNYFLFKKKISEKKKLNIIIPNNSEKLYIIRDIFINSW